ncbi:MAG TPA: VWA domain-containing protein [Thermoanaerobaculia bacterium]|jgi:VWFA-related protein|nr:VWA domain-containing protein [Thermoanaerobaculia bacterium]
MKRFAACVVAVLFAIPIASGQEAAPPAKEPPLAMLSLVVTDSRGNHIPALKQDDFQLSIGGTPVDVEKFSERGAAGVPAGEMRRIVILFDGTTLSGGARRQAAEALHGFLTRALRPGDLVAILEGGQSLRTMTGWTSNLTEVDAALQQMSGASSTPSANGQAAAEKRIREIATDIRQAGKSGHTFYTFDALIDAARAYAAASYRDAEDTLSMISAAVSLFTPRTRNVLIVVGGGLPQTPGAGVFQYVETIRTSAQSGVLGTNLQSGAQASSPMGESSSYDLTPLFNSFGMRAWRRGAVFYAIASDINEDAGSHIDMQQAGDRLAAFTNAAGRFAGYHLLAEETGGVAFVGRSAADALDRVVSDLDSFYTVGVHPTAPISGKQAVAVKVSNGYSVRVTRGSAGSGTPADEMESRVIANQMFKPTDNDLGISLNAAPPVFEGERRLVTVDVLIPIRKLKLVPEGDGVAGAFTVFISTGDPVGNSSSVNRQTKEIHWPAAAVSHAGDKALTFRVNVVLEPGRSQISVGVMDEKSQEKGFGRLSV